MSSDPEYLPAWSCEDAARRTLGRHLVREYMTTKKELERRPPPSIGEVGRRLNSGSRGGYVDYVRKSLLDKYDRAASQIEKGLRDLLAAEKLVAFGRKHDRLATLEPMPSSAWPSMRIGIEARRAVIWRPKTIVHDIRIYPILEAPTAINYLAGMTLAAAIAKFIFDDPIVDVFRRQVRTVQLELDRRRKTASFLWPVTRSSQPTTLGLITVSQLANLVLAKRIGRLIEYLSITQLVALGNNGEFVEPIPTALWTEPNIYLDLKSGAVFRLPRGTPDVDIRAIQPLFTDLMLRRREETPYAFQVKPTASVAERSVAKKAEVAPIGKATVNLDTKDKLASACEAWLAGIIGASPKKRTHSIKTLVGMSKEKWPDLSARAMIALRTTVAKRLEANTWFKPGAPDKI